MSIVFEHVMHSFIEKASKSPPILSSIKALAIATTLAFMSAWLFVGVIARLPDHVQLFIGAIAAIVCAAVA